jgi:hypothetical protein
LWRQLAFGGARGYRTKERERMSHYRVHILDPSGKIIGAVQFDCVDIETAQERIKQLAGDDAVFELTLREAGSYSQDLARLEDDLGMDPFAVTALSTMRVLAAKGCSLRCAMSKLRH